MMLENSYHVLIKDALTLLRQEALVSSGCFVAQEELCFFQRHPEPPPPAKSPLPEKCAKPLSVAPPLPHGAPVVVKQTPSSTERPAPPKELPKPIPNVTQDTLFQEISPLLQKLAPKMPLVRQIPDDLLARKRATAYKEHLYDVEMVVLCFEEAEKEKLFLHNLTKAIHRSLRPAKLIDGKQLEKEQGWELFLGKNPVRWIVCSPRLHQYPRLLRFYRENVATKERFLGNEGAEKNLLLLSPISAYLQDPSLKVALWKRLCTIASSL